MHKTTIEGGHEIVEAITRELRRGLTVVYERSQPAGDGQIKRTLVYTGDENATPSAR